MGGRRCFLPLPVGVRLLDTKVSRWGISWARVLDGATEACRGDRLDLTFPAKSTY